mgnify:CR=1 FL=1
MIYSYKKLIKFSTPMIIVMVLASIYGIVDGVFVSNIVGDKAFEALNLIMPYIMIIGSFGFMLGTGGAALISKKIGENKKEEANKIFSMLIEFLIILGIILTVIGIFLSKPVASLLGAKDEHLELATKYAISAIAFITFFMLQNACQSYLIVADKRKLSLISSLCAGITNMLLDFIFMYVMRLGIIGAGLGTGISYIVGGGMPLCYFLFNKKGILKFKFTTFDFKAIGQSCYNGLSEMLTNIAVSCASLVYNFQLMKIIGTEGLAAYGVIMYVSYIFIAMYNGFSISFGPLIGLYYGMNDKKELKNLLKKGFSIVLIAGIEMTLITILLAKPFALIFVSYNKELTSLTTLALRLYSISFIFSGVNIISSSFFTGLNNGFVSGAISFLRSFVFQVAMIFIIPLIFKDGIWLAVVAAEVLGVIVSVYFLKKNKIKYGY